MIRAKNRFAPSNRALARPSPSSLALLRCALSGRTRALIPPAALAHLHAAQIDLVQIMTVVGRITIAVSTTEHGSDGLEVGPGPR